jgi:peptidyl-prolyl cis-trans isomerase C
VTSAIGRWLREPLVEFLLVGLLLFGGYHWLGRTAEQSAPLDRIELTSEDVQQIRLTWLAQGRASPSAEEMRSLVDARIREEILYREALALGLDKDDTIVRRRLAQKMEFLFEDVAALREPTAAELGAWYEQHAVQFVLPARASFQHVYFSPDLRGGRAHEAASQALTTLSGGPGNAVDPATLGDPFMFQDYYPDRSIDDVARDFGPGFARALFALEPGVWSGPIESGYGFHLVLVEDATPARVPELTAIEPDVRREWIEEQRAGIRERSFETMRARYQVIVPDDFDAPDVARSDSSRVAPPAMAQ